MAWEILSTENERTFVMHPGGTGGFSSFLAFDRAAKRGVVLLSEAIWTWLPSLWSARFGAIMTA